MNTKQTKQFISSMVDKNYSEANKHLQKMIEAKLADRIKAALADKK
jgi:hypothetical protein